MRPEPRVHGVTSLCRPSCRHFAIYAMLVACAAAVPIREAVAREEGVDIVFLLDSSGSMWRADAEKSRYALIEAFASLCFARKGDRIGVAQFAGWNRTGELAEPLLSLRDIPEDAADRQRLVEDLAARLDAVEPLGTATDFNAAIDIALPAVGIASPRPEGRYLLAVILSDGETSVVDGNSVRQEYIDLATKIFDDINPSFLGHAASNIFYTRTLPRLQLGGGRLAIVTLGPVAEPPGDFLRKAKLASDVDVVEVEESGLRNAFLKLLDAARKGGVRAGPADVQVLRGSKLSLRLEILPGTRATRVAIFGASAEYDVTVTSPPGTEQDVVPFTVFGLNRRQRVIWLDGLTPGRYVLQISGRDDNPVAVEVACLADVETALAIRSPENSAVQVHGEPMVVKASVIGRDGKPVDDPRLLAQTRVTISLADPDGTVSGDEISFAGKPDGNFEASLPTANLIPGHCRFSARLRILPLSDGAGSTPGTVRTTPSDLTLAYDAPEQYLNILLVPRLEVGFAKDVAWAGHTVRVSGTLVPAVNFPPETIWVDLSPDEHVDLKLTGSTYEGDIVFRRPGTWRITRQKSGSVVVVPDDMAKIDITAAALRVLSATPPHEELRKLDYPVRYMERTGESPGSVNSYDIPVILEMDVFDETGSPEGSSELRPSRDLRDAGLFGSVELSLEPLVPDPSRKGRVRTSLTLTIDTDEAVPTKVGELMIWVSTGGVTQSAELPVRLSFVDYREKIFWLYMKYWLPVALILGLALLLAVWWFMFARFAEHQIWPVGKAGCFYKLRSLNSRSRRRARGTPEVRDAALFRMKGLRLIGGGQVEGRAASEHARLVVNGKDRADWTPLSHGDEILVGGEGETECSYFYFERPPTDEDRLKMEGYFVTLGLDEWVVEGL